MRSSPTAQTIRGYSFETGEELWTLGPNSEVTVATPIIADGMAIVTANYPPARPIYAVRPGPARRPVALLGGGAQQRSDRLEPLPPAGSTSPLRSPTTGSSMPCG